MNYREFKKKVDNWPIIFSRDIMLWQKDSQVARNQLERWRKKGLLLRLKKGVFILAKDERKYNPSRLYLANQLYGPSYVSLEYAMNYYGLIPERVSDITSIATRKTMRIKNEIGLFLYQHVKTNAFRGFELLKDENGFPFFIAEPEKAVIDFIYLNLDKFGKEDVSVFEKSYRFQNFEKLNAKKIIRFAGFFENKKLDSVARLFVKLLKKGNKK